MVDQSKPAAGEGRAGEALSDARAVLLDQMVRRRRMAAAAGQRIVPAAREGLLPVSEQQRYLWFLHQVLPEVPLYNMAFPLRLRGSLDQAALRTALHQVVNRHEALRTRFGSDRGLPYQIIDPEPAESPLRIVDVRDQDPDRRWPQAMELVGEEVRRPFDLAAGPLFRALLVRAGDDDHVLTLTVHHITCDGWSTGILTRELAEFYDAALAGRPARSTGLETTALITPALITPAQITPVDHAVWQRGGAAAALADRQLEYWRQALADLPAVDFPTDRPRPAQWTGLGEALTQDWPAELIDAAKKTAAAENTSLLGVLSAALFTVLARHTGQRDLAFGSVFSGRGRTELEPVVGFFANTLVLRVDTGGDLSARELIARCHHTVVDALANQDVPFGTVVEALQPDRMGERNPLFQISFNLLPDQVYDTFHLDGLQVENVAPAVGVSRFDLSMQLAVRPDGSGSYQADYSTDLFERGRIERFIAHFRTALEAIVADPSRPVAGIEILPPAERERLTDSWNPAPVDFGTGHLLLHDLVANRAAADGSRPAVRFEGADLTYGDLDARANRLARLLQDEFGVAPGAVVGFLLHRGPEVPTAQLGVLKAGGAWLPLDPAHPAGRIAYQCSNADVRAVVTTRALAGLLPPDVPSIVLDDAADGARLAGLDSMAPPCAARPDDVAYVIYTSGSTGNPKGVQVPHRAAVNFVGAAAGLLFSITPADRVLQFANPTFDVSVFDVYAALCSGATCISAPTAVLHDPTPLAQLMRTESVTVADIPPAVLGMLDDADLPDLRALFVGLEAFPAELVNRWRTTTRAFHNGYGPTEATVACVDYECPSEPLTASPPIGRAMANCRAYVVDALGDLVPQGVPGELCIAGKQLARGYLGQPAMTAEKFVPCPWGAPGERMYRTGDVVRWREDGELEFLGRVDRQVKIRGLRVELGEIEHAMAAFPGVRHAAVVVAAADGGPRLDAYVVADGASDGFAAELRAHLADRLPLHMVPTTFTLLDRLPLTSSGKLDHKLLPEPVARPETIVPPATATEGELAGIWSNLLGVDLARIGQGESFFALGGSSLQATQLIARIRDAFFVDLDVRELFNRPLLHQVAEFLDSRISAELGADELAALQAQVADLSEEELDRLLAAGDE
ncbi:non-ribosomal peptide synthetase [Catenulispora rubra]|uniref:non-ribosomal peptide synthetase n=1 Tax=Catenulispora rubra TaxID=280293 RepID=UPI0018920BA7|nr:non-ribosomal peptide synthetase [Catenulispora rubra]